MGTEWYIMVNLDTVWDPYYGYIMVRYGNSMVHGWGILSMVHRVRAKLPSKSDP